MACSAPFVAVDPATQPPEAGNDQTDGEGGDHRDGEGDLDVVMIDAAGHCRLLDFGIAAPADGDAGGALFGTPGYLSPEQARGETIGPASDLFSLGVIFYELLTG